MNAEIPFYGSDEPLKQEMTSLHAGLERELLLLCIPHWETAHAESQTKSGLQLIYWDLYEKWKKT